VLRIAQLEGIPTPEMLDPYEIAAAAKAGDVWEDPFPDRPGIDSIKEREAEYQPEKWSAHEDMTSDDWLAKALHALRPGYYIWEGRLARRAEQSQRPEVWNGQEWTWVQSLSQFDHEATRLSCDKALKFGDNLPPHLEPLDPDEIQATTQPE
jgi:hypothetical protein